MIEQLTTVEFFDKYGVFMVENGIITPYRFMHHIHYQTVIAYRGRGFSKTESMDFAAKEHRCHVSSIKRSIKYMTDPAWRCKHNGGKDPFNKPKNDVVQLSEPKAVVHPI